MTTTELTKIWGKISGLFARKTDVATKADVAMVRDFCPLIEDTRSNGGQVITGVAPFTTLANGQRILLQVKQMIPNDAVLRLTLADGTVTQDIPMYQSYQSTINRSWLNNIRAGMYIELIYTKNDNRWTLVGNKDTNTTYSGLSKSLIEDGTSTNNCVVSPAVLRECFYIKDEVDEKVRNKYVPSGILHHGLMSLTAQPGEVYTSRLTLPFRFDIDDGRLIENREVICLIVPVKFGRSVKLNDYITNYEEVVKTIDTHNPVVWLLSSNNIPICFVDESIPDTWYYHPRYDSDGSRLRLLVLNLDPSVVPAIKFTQDKKIVPVYDIEEKSLTTPRFTKGTAQQLFDLTSFQWASSKKGMFPITIGREASTGNTAHSNFVIELLRRRVYYARRQEGKFVRYDYNTLAKCRKVFVPLKGQKLFKKRESLGSNYFSLQRYTVIIRAARCNKHRKRLGAWMYYKLHFTMEDYDSGIAQFAGLQPFKWHDHIRP